MAVMAVVGDTEVVTQDRLLEFAFWTPFRLSCALYERFIITHVYHIHPYTHPIHLSFLRPTFLVRSWHTSGCLCSDFFSIYVLLLSLTF